MIEKSAQKPTGGRIEKPPQSQLARNIEYWRELRGLSQAALSQKSGLAASGINDILKSPDRSPRLATVEAIAGALGITVWELLEGPSDAGQERAFPVQGGLTILDRAQYSPGEEMLYVETCKRFEVEPGSADMAEVIGFDSLPLGYVPSNVILIVPAPDYSGSAVVVRDSSGPQTAVTLRYCAPPWLIGFRHVGVPFHEFMERPGLEILGVARHVRMASDREIRLGAAGSG